MSTRILLASAVSSIRSALRLLLEYEGFAVVGEASDVSELRHALLATRPQLLLADWALPAWGQTPNLASAMGDIPPEVAVVVLSRRPEDRGSALAAGARSFAYLGDAPEQLLKAVAEAAPED